MRFHIGCIMALTLVAGCNLDHSAPVAGGIQKGELNGRHINGRVISLAFLPESTFVGVPGAAITVLQTSADSGDSAGMHPDSLTPLMLRGRPLFPGDTSWIDTLPGDSIMPPIDTVTPPPQHGCAERGEQVATAVTDADGNFSITGLTGGTYDIVVVSPPGHLGTVSCFVDLRFQQSVDLQIFVPPVADTTLPQD